MDMVYMIPYRAGCQNNVLHSRLSLTLTVSSVHARYRSCLGKFDMLLVK